eukprot:5640949-Pleurochrysis_carterae.AAC.2
MRADERRGYEPSPRWKSWDGEAETSGCEAGSRCDSHGHWQRMRWPSTVRLRERVVFGTQCSDGLSDMLPSADLTPPHCRMWVAWVQRRAERWASLGAMPGVTSREVYFCVVAPMAHCGKVSREQRWLVRRVSTAGIIHKEACAASMKMGDFGCPRSAGCSSMYSEPASRAAERMAVVRRTSSFASASSRLCCGATSRRPRGCSRLLRIGGPPSGDGLERKCREMENVEHGGEATTAAYSPVAQRWRSRWQTESLSSRLCPSPPP